MTDPRPQWQIEQGAACGCRGVDDYCVCQNVQRTPPTEGEGSRDGLDRQWRPVETVADLVNNLLTLDQTMLAHGAIFVNIEGRSRAKIRPLSLSREKVSGPWIESGADGPWHLVIWSNADERRDGLEPLPSAPVTL